MQTTIARSLAAQMTAAGITPQNVEQHPAFLRDASGRDHLAYAQDDNDCWVLGLRAYSLQRDGQDWLCWDEHGTRSARIKYTPTGWVVD